jgi:ketosteroid isomerase-like protein
MRKTILVMLTAACYSWMVSCNGGNNQKHANEAVQEPTLDKKWARGFVDSLNQNFSEEIASADSAALASHYWPNAELLLDNSEVVKGEDIIHAWGNGIRAGIKEVSFSTTDIAGSSDYIIETGNYEMKDGSKNLLDRGKYVVVWEKRNGEWKLYRDIGSTSMPARQ